MINRTLKDGQTAIEQFSPENVGNDAVGWLTAQARAGMILLAHADDGVIWGRRQADGLVFPAPTLFQQAQLRNLTLQKARLFDADQELFLWRTGEGRWRARRITDGQGEPVRFYDEPQVLWGSRVEATQGGFSLVTEGAQGLRHAPPIALRVEDWKRNRLYLGVRHYLTTGEDGALRVMMSRLIYLRRN